MYAQQPQQGYEPYYGPTVPPPGAAAYYAPPRRRCACTPCRCILWTIIGLGTALALAVFIFWLVFRPEPIKVTATSATLNQFNLSTSLSGAKTLSFNLSTVVSVENPNSKVGIYYDWLVAEGFYNYDWFQTTPLPTFFQDTKNTTVFTPVLFGTARTVVADQKFGTDKSTSFFVNYWLYGTIRLKFGGVTTGKRDLRVNCPLNLSLGKTVTNVGCQVTRW